jgi:hypothetical protein
MEQIRRLLPRQFADWRAKCLFGDDPEERWHGCRVVDVSSAGAGLELPDTAPEDVIGTAVVVVIQLRAEVRNARAGKDQGLRMGIQFVNLTESERSYLDSLEELKAVW